MAWVEVFAAFVVAHAVGDYLLQTDWQARHKRNGLGGDPLARRALFSHVAVYTLAFVPVLAALWDSLGAGVLAVAALVFLPHLVQDDGRLLTAYIERVKGARGEVERSLFTSVDQSFHLLALFLLALAAGS